MQCIPSYRFLIGVQGLVVVYFDYDHHKNALASGPLLPPMVMVDQVAEKDIHAASYQG